MTRARRTQISLDETPYYHCICRCVRRAFLCGKDHYSGQDYAHRRQWVVDRLAVLVDMFAIDLCAYAVMSNHYHVVLRVDRSRALGWSDREVAEHWMRLFSGPLLVRRWLNHETGEGEALKALEIIEKWRERLYDIGWFMRCLNEHLARLANDEDNCKGRFWEGRYKCQALLDEKAVLSCMAYVDLNPVRAGMAATPEASEYTSVQQRANALNGHMPETTPPKCSPRHRHARPALAHRRGPVRPGDGCQRRTRSHRFPGNCLHRSSSGVCRFHRQQCLWCRCWCAR